jgi:hypothetical protein
MTHLLGLMGSALIILQLGLLSHNFTSQQVLVVAMVAATVWIGYALIRRDPYLLATNAIAFMAGISGIMFA